MLESVYHYFQLLILFLYLKYKQEQLQALQGYESMSRLITSFPYKLKYCVLLQIGVKINLKYCVLLYIGVTKAIAKNKKIWIRKT